MFTNNETVNQKPHIYIRSHFAVRNLKKFTIKGTINGGKLAIKVRKSHYITLYSPQLILVSKTPQIKILYKSQYLWYFWLPLHPTENTSKIVFNVLMVAIQWIPRIEIGGP